MRQTAGKLRPRANDVYRIVPHGAAFKRGRANNASYKIGKKWRITEGYFTPCPVKTMNAYTNRKPAKPGSDQRTLAAFG